LGDPAISTENRQRIPGPATARRPLRGSKSPTPPGYRQAKEDEARRDEWPEVLASDGFRPGRGAHQALEALWKQTMINRGGWIVEVDIRKFFDTLDHRHLREFIGRRVRDGVLLRLIGKWLNAGVMENGSVSYPDSGSPQGGVICLPPAKSLIGAPILISGTEVGITCRTSSYSSRRS